MRKYKVVAYIPMEMEGTYSSLDDANEEIEHLKSFNPGIEYKVVDENDIIYDGEEENESN